MGLLLLIHLDDRIEENNIAVGLSFSILNPSPNLLLFQLDYNEAFYACLWLPHSRMTPSCACGVAEPAKLASHSTP